MIDRLKHLHAIAVERLHPRRVVFHHVPKCGGTSVGRALRRRFLLSQATIAPEASYRALEAFTGIRDRERLLVEVLDLREQMLLYHLFQDVRCISAHVRFSTIAHALFRSSYRFMTVLREPVARFLSHYRWSYGKAEAHGRIEEPFEAFLETERARRLGATYVEYFSGLPKEADPRSELAVAAAIRNLGKLDVVGRLDRLGEFAGMVSEAVGVRPRIGHENTAAGRPDAVALDLSLRLRAKVTEVCEPDIAVWQAVAYGDASRRLSRPDRGAIRDERPPPVPLGG